MDFGFIADAVGAVAASCGVVGVIATLSTATLIYFDKITLKELKEFFSKRKF